MFDRIAPRYDLLNRCLSAGFDRRWRRRGVDALALVGGARLLDLCTGTADVLIEWLGRDARNSGVGVDVSPAMLAIGRGKLARHGDAGRSALAVSDAERLPFADAVFDGAAVAFGLRNVAGRAAALGEAARVLKPGAPLVVLEIGWPTGRLGRAYRRYFSYVLPQVGGWLSRDARAYAYLPESVRLFPPPAEMMAELRAAGFEDAAALPLTGGIVWLYRAVKPR
jgi:demethylmenaquinone methyltransferase/2-methoxy-6-polyprenyl-1,4-benzoquinol methylase